MTRKHSFLRPAFVLVTMLAAVLAASAAFAGTGPAKPGTDGYAKSTTVGSVDPQFLPGARTIAHWTFQYTDPSNGVTYPITMVGSDPRQGGSSTVKTEIIPLKINFVAGNQDLRALNAFYGINATPLTWTADPTAGSPSDVANTLASPIFGSYHYDADLGGDTGQYGDVFMRSQFNKLGSSYHVKLSNTGVLPTVTIDVPQSQGVAYVRPAGATAGIVDVTWFSAKLQNLMNGLHIDPTTVPIFVTHNVLLYDGNDYRNCCILGYHGAGMPVGHGAGSANGGGNNPVQTFIYAAYTTPNTYSRFDQPTRGLADIHALSHEVAEWLDDPFVNNAVKPWLTPTAPQYGCTGVLETGDPVVGVWFPLPGNPDPAGHNVWHPEDEVFANWFGHGGVEAQGLGSWDGRKTFMGARTTSLPGGYSGFASYSSGC